MTADAEKLLKPDQNQEIMAFPLDFPIKVAGVNENGFVHAITQIAKRFDPHFNGTTIELRESSSAKYLSITITVHATSHDQLDNIYRELTAHPLVRWVL